MRTDGAVFERSAEGLAAIQLRDFLSRAGRRSFEWGSLDCLLFAADWVRECSGDDPAAQYRGTYTDQRAARLIMLRAGGIVALMARCLVGVGWHDTTAPRAGAVGLVRVPLRRVKDCYIVVPVGAVCVAPGLWAVKPADKLGLIVKDFPLMRAWSHDA